MALHHRELISHPRQTQQPHSGHWPSFFIDGPTRDGQTWTEFDHRRHVCEALERRRGAGDVGDEDRGALALGHGQIRPAVSVRDRKALRFGSHGRHPRSRPDQVHARAGKWRTVGRHLHGEIHSLPQRELHRVLFRGHVQPGRGKAFSQRLEAPCLIIIAEQGEHPGFDDGRWQQVSRHLSPHRHGRRGHSVLGCERSPLGLIPGHVRGLRGQQTDVQRPQSTTPGPAGGSRVLAGLEKPGRTGIAPRPAICRRSAPCTVVPSFPDPVRRHRDPVDEGGFTLPRADELERLAASRFLLSRHRDRNAAERDTEKADRRPHCPSLPTRPGDEFGPRTLRPPAHRLRATRRPGAG